MNDVILIMLVTNTLGLLALGVFSTVSRAPVREAIGFGGAGLSGLAAVLCVLSLLLGDEPAGFALPIGLPGAAFHLAIDPLSAAFALLVFLSGAATCAQVANCDATNAPALLICLAGLAFAVLASDGLALGTGLAVSVGAIWLPGLAAASVRRPALPLAISLLAAGSSTAAGALFASPGAAFATVRGATPSPVALCLVTLPLAGLAGVAPAHRWLLSGSQAMLPRASALLTGAVMPVAFYVLTRLLFDLTGSPLPAWYGLLWVALGAASVAAGGTAATRQETMNDAVIAGATQQSGSMGIGVGLGLIGRSLDLPGLSALALAAVFLLAATQALCGTLVMLGVGEIQRGAGSVRLDRLGGLIHRMPVTSFCLLTGLFGLAALPLSAGFAGLWLLFHAILAVPRADGLATPVGLVLAVGALGLGLVLGTASSVRLFGVACLGRPRSPRAAVADEPSRPVRIALVGLAAGAGGLGVLPGPALHLLADPTIRMITGIELGPRAGFWGLAPAAGSPGYAALLLAIVVGLVAAALRWWLRRQPDPDDARSGPAWEDGFAPPPAWLPFGDPLTQSAGAGFALIPDITVRPPRLRLLQRLPRFGAPAVVLLVLVGLLIVLEWLQT